MWADAETDRDYLNFTSVANTVAELIVGSAGNPISIGVSGAWGVGKSSMIKLIRRNLQERQVSTATERIAGAAGSAPPKLVFVEFNAWLYQGYDDARAALMDVIARELTAEAARQQTGMDHVKAFVSRINWMRGARVATHLGAAAFGLPPVGLIGEVASAIRGLSDGKIEDKDIKGVDEALGNAVTTLGGLLKAAPESSPPQEIQALRTAFEQALEELQVVLVVLIDDLDRCLPETTISTLEAIRLFLFLNRTAFVIAADDNMIKHAVRKHFEGMNDESVVINYFDKLIQVPVRVPPLSTQDVRAYLLLLLVEDSTLHPDQKAQVVTTVNQALREGWNGTRLDGDFVVTRHPDLPEPLKDRLRIADHLAPLLATAEGIHGNPRLIKRFLNALSIRRSVAAAHGTDVPEDVLAKMLLFERLGSTSAMSDLIRQVSQSSSGKASFLHEWETSLQAGEPLTLSNPWHDEFIEKWLALPPALGDIDLRPAIHVGREHAPLFVDGPAYTRAALELLTAMNANPGSSTQLEPEIKTLVAREAGMVMDALLREAQQVTQWGAPRILDDCLAVARAHVGQAGKLTRFLQSRPLNRLEPSLVPKIAGESWAAELFTHWKTSGAPLLVINAINAEERRRRG